MKKFKHLNIPSHWRQYWTQYPEGYTILEALINWVGQVDDMVDSYNQLTDHVDNFKEATNNTVDGFREELSEFLEQFDSELQTTVTDTLIEWQASGFLDVVIDQALETKYHEMDERLTAGLAETESRSLDNEAKLGQAETRLENLSRHINEFGAVGDGVTDDYDAFVLATEYFNEKGSGKLILDPKTYKLDRYRVIGGDNANNLEPIYFENLDGFTIEGNGATIILKGDIHRSHDYDSSGFNYSYVHQLSVYFETCDNLTIRNLNIDGEIFKMTRDTGVIEGGGYGLRINGCRNVLIEKSSSKRMSMDSIALMPSNKLFNGIRRICRNVTLRDSEFSGSSRQGLTAGHFVDLLIDNCKFNDTGKNTGSYGHTDPGLGIDFEQDYDTQDVEEHSRRAIITNSEIINNRTSISVFNSQWKELTFINCTIENDYVGNLNDVNLNGQGIEFIECTFNLIGNIGTGNPRSIMTDFTFKNCDINVGRFAMFEGPFTIVRLTHSHVTGNVYFNDVNTQSYIIGNTFFMPATRKSNESYEIVWRLKRMFLVRDNTFHTDYTGEGHFSSDYANSNDVLNDIYMSENVRPSYNSPFTKVFSKNMTT